MMIDELAEVGDKDTLDLLSSILRIGRSFRVNVVAATQLPTKATCGEKNNYTVRFVGAVTDPRDGGTRSRTRRIRRTCFRGRGVSACRGHHVGAFAGVSSRHAGNGVDGAAGGAAVGNGR